MNEQSQHPASDQGFLAGGGEMGKLTRAFDWSKTPIGPVGAWPRSLKSIVRVMLSSRYAMWLGWGPDFTFFYNDAYAKMTLGPKHPWALGRSAREVWSEIWADVGPRAESVIRTGEATWDEGLLLFLERRGFPEETYHTFSYSPVPDDDGGIGGMLCVVTEDTERTIGERRLRTLRELAARTTDEARSAEEACQTAAHILGGNPRDVSFALLYLLDAEGRTATLAGATGLSRGTALSPAAVNLRDHAGPWPFRQVSATGQAVEIHSLSGEFDPLPGGAWPEPSKQAVVLSMAKPGQTQAAGFIVAGISPRRPLDDSYRGFLELLAGQVATAVANARAYEDERRRAEKLAELDRAKTAFFSNVSHEFRTPLTLMLGPVEDLLARSHTDLPPAAAGQLEVVNRNGLRLLRLVNTLLDFSRIEAGRVRAVFQSTDLAAYTADLASVFRAACERAGLRLVVACAPLGEPAFVDREMWEKIVLNLVSNAFKFTFDGGITVSLKRVGNAAELQVRDTGTGIPAEEMPKLFERFHRVQNARGRTHEGSGIGLALVQELVKLHGGSVVAESLVGQGTTFTITVPLGAAHLPPDQIGDARAAAATGTGAGPYVEEALRWLPDGEQSDGRSELPVYHQPLPVPHHHVPAGVEDDRPRVLVADDNADMRQYIARLLAEQFQVEAVPDGAAALAAARDQPPDLVLTDVMMPRLDGFGLLRELRANPRTSSLPVIMLSARAGEESRVEGLEAGADDYLVKPFSARELLARVTAHLKMARLRQEARAAIQKERDWLKVTLTSIGDAVVTTDSTGRITLLNGVAETLTGWTNAEAVGQPLDAVFRIVNEQTREPVESPAVRALRDGVVVGLANHTILIAKDGTERPIDDSAAPVRDGQGRGVGCVLVFRDISERRRAEEALRASEERFHFVRRTSGVGFWYCDLPFDVLQWDENVKAHFHLPRDAAVTIDTFYDRLHPDDRQPTRQAIERSINERTAYDVDYRTVDPVTGAVKWVRAIGRTFYAPDGTPIRFDGVTVDVTDRKRTEEALRESELRYRLVGEAANDAIWDWNLVTNQVAWNERVRTLFGYTAAQVDTDARWWFENIHADDRDRIARAIHAAIDSGAEFWTGEYRFQRADGSYAAVLDRGRVVRDGGRPVRMVGSMLDRTERQRLENEVRESEAQYRLIVEGNPALICRFRADGTLTFVNDTYCRTFGKLREELIGRTFTPLVPDEDRPIVARLIGRLAPEMEPYTDEHRVVVADGEVRWQRWTNMAVRGGAGALAEYQAVGIDITDRKQLEDELRQVAAELSEADRRKDEFLAVLAHELRNPLAPIRNALQIMKLSDESRSREQARTLMERQLEQMVRLVDDLMDVSRITRGKIELRREKVRLDAVVSSAVEISHPLIEQLGHRLTVVLPDRPVTLDADLTRLAQVFSNLLTNAAKYTERGGDIRLTAERHGSDVVVSVKDTGIGIPADKLESIFDMFSQVDRSLERSQGGLGIGLTLVKRLVEMHDGKIEARSEGPGRGAEFIMRLPVAVEESSPPLAEREEPAAPKSKLRILVVDDNRDGADSLAMMLRIMGHDTVTAYDGQEGVEAAERNQPDVVLLDIGLPKLNGYEACRRIREQAGARSLVLIAVTGWGQDEDRRRSHAAGFDHHLVKPVDPNALMKLLADLRGVQS